MKKITFLSNSVTQVFNSSFLNYQVNHLEINTIPQVLLSKLETDYLIIIIDYRYFSIDGQLTIDSIDLADNFIGLVKKFREANNSKIIISNIFNCIAHINPKIDNEQHNILFEINNKLCDLSNIQGLAILDVFNLCMLKGFEVIFNLKNAYLVGSTDIMLDK